MWLESTTSPGAIQAVWEVIRLLNSFLISHLPGDSQAFEKGAAVHWLPLLFRRTWFQYTRATSGRRWNHERKLSTDRDGHTWYRGPRAVRKTGPNTFVGRPKATSELWPALYDASSSLVYGLALRILGEPFDAEEVTLDVFMQVWRQSSRFDPGRGNPTAWLAILARSRAVDRLRVVIKRRQRESGLSNEVDRLVSKDNPERDTLLAQQRSWLARALSTLPGEQRQAIELSILASLSHVDVAKTLGQPLGTIKSRIRLGMAKLRELGAAA